MISKRVATIVIILTALLVLPGLPRAAGVDPSTVPRITIGELKAKLNDPETIVIDVRSDRKSTRLNSSH
jgi:hypothetical protein